MIQERDSAPVLRGGLGETALNVCIFPTPTPTPTPFATCPWWIKFVFSVLGAIFIGVTIATCDVISFFLLRWLVNSCHPFDRSDVKLKPTVCWSLTFSRAPDLLLVFVLISHWLLRYLHLFLLVVANVFWLSFIDQKLQSKLTTYRG